MARLLTAQTTAALALPGTKPAYLLALYWSTPVYLTTGAGLTWNGQTWLAEIAELSSLQWSNDGLQGASLRLGNSDQRYSALALAEGVADVRVLVYAYDQTATATGDPVCVFDGRGGQLALDDDYVTIALRVNKARALFCPRLRISPASGFNHLPPRGTTIVWGQQQSTLRGGLRTSARTRR
jgi:hypothetical protein